MKVVGLQVENFQILHAVEITPEGDVVTIGGDNEQGKTAILNAIWVALKGRAVAPPMPIRKGEEECRIRLDLGELVVTRKFTDKDGTVTDSVKVESADGKQRYTRPQEVLDDLMGQLGFDPFAFVRMKPEAQAETLLEMVPLPFDLEELARFDTADYANRRDVNRDIANLDGQIAGIPERDDLPDAPPDRQALADKLGLAAETNAAIIRDRDARVADAGRLAGMGTEIESLEQRLVAMKRDRDELAAKIKAQKPLAELIDTDKVREELRAADEIAGLFEAQRRRGGLVAQRAELQLRSDGFTAEMTKREATRKAALAGAKMPIEGLTFAINDKGKPVVMFDGVPFEQASKAQQIRASTAIAMSANPELRVLRISDGSLLDKKSFAIIAEMAKAEDFQLWIELVATEGVGFVIEGGRVKGADTPDPVPAKKKPAGTKAGGGGDTGPLL